jgi:hypothetical protein
VLSSTSSRLTGSRRLRLDSGTGPGTVSDVDVLAAEVAPAAAALVRWLMARVSRSARARALREARQQRQQSYRPLGCQMCGDESEALRVEDGDLLCPSCSAESSW